MEDRVASWDGGLETKLSDEVAELLAEAAAVSARAADTAAGGDVEAALRLEREADTLRRQARTKARRQASPPSTPATGGTIRDVTIAALNELGVPSAPKALSDYAQIRFDSFLNYRALASLRRDEQRTWSSPRSQRPVYVVPALEGRRFLAVRGKLALSSWPVGRRLIGPWSERVDHLRATVNLAAQHDWLAANEPERAERLAGLLARFAATIPGASSADERFDPERVRRAAEAELEQLAPEDEEWREEAASRAAVLAEEEQLFGARPPTALMGGEA
jgi:hypothetical protein